jgi:type IV pilus assembly protein PilB
MGIDPLMVASTVNAVLAQRLGRRLCKSCKIEMPKEEYPPPDDLIKIGFLPEEIDTLKLWKPVGCSLCSHGYKGRYAIVECLEMNNEIRRVIIGGGSDLDIRKIALATGMIGLRRCALLNAMRGVSTIEEAIGQTVADEKEVPPLPKSESSAATTELAAAAN